MNKFAIVTLTAFAMLPACRQAEARGANGHKLTLTAPASQTLRQGEANDVAVKIDRDGFDGPVKIEFSQLPNGVTVANPSPIPTDDELKNYTLAVAATATPTEHHRIVVTASSGDLKVQETFEVAVKAR